MYPPQSSHIFKFIDDFHANSQPLFFLGLPVSGGFQSFRDMGVYLELGVFIQEKFCFFSAVQRKDTGDYRCLIGKAGLLYRIQPLLELVNVEDGVSLYKFSPGFDFLRKPDDA